MKRLSQVNKSLNKPYLSIWIPEQNTYKFMDSSDLFEDFSFEENEMLYVILSKNKVVGFYKTTNEFPNNFIKTFI